MLVRDQPPHQKVFGGPFTNWRSSPIIRLANSSPFSELRLALGLHSWYAKEAKMPGGTTSSALPAIGDRLSSGIKMLRIQRLANREVVLVLIGRLDVEHIAELDRLIRAEASGLHLSLDLKDMTLAGQEGIDFLAQCEDNGIALMNCAPYVREWITRQRNGS